MFFKKAKPKLNINLSESDKKMIIDGNSPNRSLEGEAAMALPPGEAHYKAYVGPTDRFDFMGATQFALLFHMGLRDYHSVLDFGCGSLRLGRCLIPYLQKEKYFGIDPNQWLIEDGTVKELGADAIALKSPRFSHNIDFNCEIFDKKFDFIIAQSIFTHTGPSHFKRFLESASKALKPDGVLLFTYNGRPDDSQELPEDGWYYPQCVTYHDTSVQNMISDTILEGKKIPWYHPASQWYAAALTKDGLPKDEHLYHLTGAVLRQDQFTASLDKYDFKKS